MRTRRVLLLGVGGIVALVVGLVVVALVVLQTSWAKDRIRRFAVDRANRALTGELSIGQLRGSLLSNVVLEDVRLTQEGVTVIAADEVEVTYQVSTLLRSGLVLSSVTLRSPHVRLVQDDRGWNVSRLAAPTPPSSNEPMAFAIHRLSVTGGTVDVTLASQADRSLQDVRLDASLTRDAGGLSLHVGHLVGRETTSGYAIESLNGAFLRSFRDVRAAFEATRGEARVSGGLVLDVRDDDRVVEATVDVRALDLATVLGEPRWTSDITGRATVHGTLASSPGARPSLAFAFAGPRAEAFDYQAEDLDVGGTYREGHLAFAGSAAAYGARVTTDAEWGPADVGASTGLRATGTFQDAGLSALPRRLALPALETRLNGTYAVRTNADGWSADVRLSRSILEGARIDAGTAGHVAARNGQIAFRAEGALAGLDVQRLATPLELPTLAADRFDGAVTGSFQVAGTLAGPGTRHIQADATLRDSSLGGARFDQMALDVALDGTSLTVGASGDFHNVTPTLAGTGTTVPFVVDGTADVRLVMPDMAAPLTVDALQASGRVALAPSTARGVTIRSGLVEGTFADGVARLTTLRIDAADLEVRGQGTIALGNEGTSAFTLTAAAEDLSTIGEVFGVDVSGAANLEADVTGPAGAPVIDGTLNARSLEYASASALTFDTSFQATIPDLDPSRAGGRSTWEATFVSAKGIDIVRLRGRADFESPRLTLDTRIEQESRTVEVEGTVTLEPEQRKIALQRLQIDTAGVVWSLAAGAPARIDLDPQRATVDGLALVRGDQRLEVSGQVALGDEPPGDLEPLRVRADRVQLADVNQVLLGERRLEGLLHATATVTGAMTSPDVSGDFVIVNGQIETMPFNAARGSVRYTGAVAEVDAELQQTSTNRLSIEGTVATAAATVVPPGIDLTVTSTPIDLAFVQGFTTAVTEVTGTGAFDVRVTGTVEAPVVDGTVSIDQAGFTVDATGVRYPSLTAQLSFDRNHLQIGQFQLVDDDGHTLSAEGGLDVIGRADERSLDVRLIASNVHVLDNDTGSLQIDGTVQASGGFLSPQLSGTLRVSEGRLEVDQILEAVTRDVYSTTPEVPEATPVSAVGSGTASVALQVEAPAGSSVTPAVQEEETSGLFERVGLDLSIELPDNLVLRGRDLRMAGSSIGLGDVNITTGGSVTVDKATGAPMALAGALEVTRGYYSFQGRRFDVQRASTVRFRGQTPIDPALSITATRTISGVETVVAVEGSMREPTVSLSSQPPLDDAEILSLIVFGQQINELGGAERTSLTERVASMAAGAVATPLADSVAQALNLDLFEIQAPTGSTAPVVQLGSQIGDRLYVGVRQEVGRGDRRRITLEYRLSDVLRLVTSLAQGAAEQRADQRTEAGGVDLVYEKRY